MNTVYQTRAGVKVGLLYRRPAPGLDRDGLLLQSALLDRRTRQARPLLLTLLGVFFKWL